MKRDTILAALFGLALILSAAVSEGRPVVRPPDPVRALYVLAHVDVTEDHTQQAIAAIRSYVEAARREPGAMRLEAMQETRPNHFDIIEVWRDDAAYQAHETSQTTISFHDAIAPWRGSPFEERLGSAMN